MANLQLHIGLDDLDAGALGGSGDRDTGHARRAIIRSNAAAE